MGDDEHSTQSERELPPDDSPEKDKAGNLSGVDPKGREKVKAPPTEPVTEDGDD